MMLIQDLLHGFHVVGIAHERMGNEINVQFDSQQDVLFILFGERRQIDVLARNVHTLMRTQHTVVLHLCHHHGAVAFDNLHVELTIVEEHVVAHFHIFGNIAIRNVDDIVRRVHFGATKDFNDVASFVAQGFIDTSCAHFGTFRINHNPNMRRHCPHILHNGSNAFLCSVRRVHAHHIHARKK